MTLILFKYNFGEIRHYHGEIRPMVDGMSMGLKKAIQKRDYNFGEYLPIGQPEHKQRAFRWLPLR